MAGSGRIPIDHPEGVFGNYAVEVLYQPRSVQQLRGGLLKLCYTLLDKPSLKGLLLLLEPKISGQRVYGEFALAWKVLRPELVERVTIQTQGEGRQAELPLDLGEEFRARLDKMVLAEWQEGITRLGRPRAVFVVLQILVHQWLLGRGAMTTDWLMGAAGSSYPTVANALSRLEPWLNRQSDRRVELKTFPKQEWARWLGASDEVRSTVYYADRSGQPRSAEALLKRLGKISRKDIAVGGVFGARHYYPDLDLVGSPRLDLSVHAPGKSVDLGFVERLDPALERVKDRGEPARLAVHLVRRADAFFEREGETLWADPTECLLDLGDNRLESQALHFVDFFVAKRRAASQQL